MRVVPWPITATKECETIGTSSGGTQISRFTIDDHVLDNNPYEVQVIGG